MGGRIDALILLPLYFDADDALNVEVEAGDVVGGQEQFAGFGDEVAGGVGDLEGGAFCAEFGGEGKVVGGWQALGRGENTLG